jgi:hypothetical protein
MSEAKSRVLNTHAVKAVNVDNYLYVSLVDPDSGEVHDLLFSRSQWEVAHERAIKRISTLPLTREIASWKVWILRLLGFDFI